jgi:transcriptional regulator with XRE-family HTH domain
MEGFGAWLQKQMTDKGLDVGELALKLRLTDSAVYQWLKNETRPGPENIRRLARVLRLDPLDIYAARDRVRPSNAERDPLISEMVAAFETMDQTELRRWWRMVRASFDEETEAGG